MMNEIINEIINKTINETMLEVDEKDFKLSKKKPEGIKILNEDSKECNGYAYDSNYKIGIIVDNEMYNDIKKVAMNEGEFDAFILTSSIHVSILAMAESMGIELGVDKND